MAENEKSVLDATPTYQETPLSQSESLVMPLKCRLSTPPKGKKSPPPDQPCLRPQRKSLTREEKMSSMTHMAKKV